MAEPAREPRYLRPLRSAAEWLVAILAIGAPVFIGGVHPHVMVAVGLLGGVALLLVMAGRRGELPTPPAAWALAGGGVLALLTIVPLPYGIVAAVSPRAAALSFLPPDPPPAFARLSLDPSRTIVDLARIFGLTGVMLAASALAVRMENARRLVRIIALAGIAVCVASLAHVALGLTALFGIVPQSFEGRQMTTFVDPNHACSLAILSSLACLGLARSAGDKPLQRGLWYSGFAACVVMGISTQSVAGLASMAVALAIFVMLSVGRKPVSSRRRRTLRIVLPGLATALALIAFLSAAVLFLDQWDYIVSAGLSKVGAWPAAVRMILDSRWAGVGRAAFGTAFELYTPAHDVTVVHPENFLLQWSAEWGVPAAVLGIAALGMTLWRAFRVTRQEDALGALQDALLAGIIGVLLHELADFALEYAGVSVAFCVGLGVLTAKSARPVHGRTIPLLLGAAGVASAIFAARTGMAHLVDAQLTEASFHSTFQSGAQTAQIDRTYRDILVWHPTDFLVPMRAAEMLLRRASDPVTPRESRAALEKASLFLDRAQEVTKSDWPWFSRAWLESQEGHRVASLDALGNAFSLGERWADVARFATRLDATPAELSMLPVREAHSPSATEKSVAASACEVMAVTRDGHYSRLVTQSILERIEKKELHESEGLLDCACATLAKDAGCASRNELECDTSAFAPTIANEALRVGNRWRTAHPDDDRAYLCVSKAYAVLHAPEEQMRVLLMAQERFGQDPRVIAALADAELSARQPALAVQTLKGLVPEISEPRVSQLVRTVRVRALWELGQKSRALREAEEAIRFNPTAYWAYSLATSFNELQGNYAVALGYLNRCFQYSDEGDRLFLTEWRRRLIEEQGASIDLTSPDGSSSPRGKSARRLPGEASQPQH